MGRIVGLFVEYEDERGRRFKAPVTLDEAQAALVAMESYVGRSIYVHELLEPEKLVMEGMQKPCGRG